MAVKGMEMSRRLAVHIVRLLLSAIGVCLAVVILASPARAGCNLIAGTEIQFPSQQGTVDRPFAAPGEPVEVALRNCDGTALSTLASDHLVTVVFTPTSGERNAVVLADDCSGLTASLATCSAQPGVGKAICIDGAAAGLRIVDRDGQQRLQFRFPDTDPRCRGGGPDEGAICSQASDCTAPATCSPDDDDRTLTGAAVVAISTTSDPLPCDVDACTSASGLTACIDRFFAETGSCDTAVPARTFPSFTALPVPNLYQIECVDEQPPCEPTLGSEEVRFALDATGNVLIPFVWDGIREQLDGQPAARLVSAEFSLPAGTFPGPSFLTSFAPDGRVIAPVFEPQASGVSTNLKLFGSTDAPYTILRGARRSDSFQACVGGADDRKPVQRRQRMRLGQLRAQGQVRRRVARRQEVRKRSRMRRRRRRVRRAALRSVAASSTPRARVPEC